MNERKPSLDLGDNYMTNIMCAPIMNPDVLDDPTVLHPGTEEIRNRNGNFYGSVLVPPAIGSLESLVAQGFSTTNNYDQQPPSPLVVYSSTEANMSSVQLQGVHTNMADDVSFTDSKSSVSLMPANQLNNNLASTASSSRYVNPNTNDTCYQRKIRRRRNKLKEQQELSKKRSQSINGSLNALITMSGTNTYKADTASMLEGMTNHMKLLHLQTKMANIMNIAPKDVTLVIRQYLRMFMHRNLNTVNVVGAMNSSMNGQIGAGKGPVDPGTILSTPAMAITQMSVVHPTTYLPTRQTSDPVLAHTCAPAIDPIVAYVVAAGKTELPSMDEVAELIPTFERLQQTLDFN